MKDPQNDAEILEDFIEQADKLIQERILTSVDEGRYCAGDMVEEIHELAAELWEQAEEDKKTGRADHEMDQLK